MPTTELQIAHERAQVDAGIRRYRASLSKTKEDGSIVRKAIGDTEPGQIIARDLIGPLVEALRSHQAATVETLCSNGNAKPQDGDMMLLILPADVLAAVTVLAALNITDERTFTGSAMSLGSKVKDEYDYAKWVAAERDAERGRRDTPDSEAVVNLAKLMQARNKVVDERVFKKWSKKADLFATSKWDKATRIALGTILLTKLVESNGWFEVALNREAGQFRKVRVIRMTDAGRAFVSDRHNQNELMRPHLKPMLIEPRDYHYVEVQPAESPCQ